MSVGIAYGQSRIGDDWTGQAACRPGGMWDPELWWPEQGDHAGASLALHICRVHCPVRERCDEHEGPRVTYPCVVGGRRYAGRSGWAGKVVEAKRAVPSGRDCPVCESP